MFWHIEVQGSAGVFDSVGEGIKKDIPDLGIKTVWGLKFIQVYLIKGDLTFEEITRICRELLTDPVCQKYTINQPVQATQEESVIEIAYNPGVMDPVEESTLKGIRDLGITGEASVKTAKKYIIRGKPTPRQLKTVAEKLIYNKLIQHIVIQENRQALGKAGANYQFNLITVDMLSVSQQQLREISRSGQLFLNLDEMCQIQAYFKKLGRNPTDCELETIAQTWSEHCMHKTFRGRIQYMEQIRNPKSGIRNKSKIRNPKFKTKRINNLLKSTIMKATKELNKPWCVSVFKDNSGIIRFDDTYNV